MRNIYEIDGANVRGVNINNIRYAIYIVLMTDSEDKLQSLVSAVTEIRKERDLNINKMKTEAMVIAGGGEKVLEINIENERVNQAIKFCYLGV